MSEAIGDTGYLHATRADVRILVSSVGTDHNEVVELWSHPAVLAHTASRGLARIVGQITVTVEGPGAQTKTTQLRAAIVPQGYSGDLSTKALVFARPLAAAVKSAIYLNDANRQLPWPTAVDHQLVPEPALKNRPKLALAWTVDGGAATDQVDVALDFTLELAGIGYV